MSPFSQWPTNFSGFACSNRVRLIGKPAPSHSSREWRGGRGARGTRYAKERLWREATSQLNGPPDLWDESAAFRTQGPVFLEGWPHAGIAKCWPLCGAVSCNRGLCCWYKRLVVAPAIACGGIGRGRPEASQGGVSWC